MELLYRQLTEEIERADSVTLFRHIRPDCDAVGSQFALKHWIEVNWPGKKVYALGFESCSQGDWPASDTVSDDVIRNSLAIVLDSADTDRVDDDRWQTARVSIKIDHHPNRTPYGDIQIVDEKSAATCEILTEYMSTLSETKMNDTITAERLYSGLLTDTLCFRTTNTTAHTLSMAAVLANVGVPLPELNRELFDHTLEEFRFANAVRDNLILCGKKHQTGIVVLDEDILHRWGMTPSDARNYIDEIGHIRELQFWAIFTQDPQDHLYDGSLRSKVFPVNDLARQYRGGGHRNAAGVKDLAETEMNELIRKMSEEIVV